MTYEEFEKRLSEISDNDLIKMADDQISKLAKTGGRSHTMTVPARLDDTDIVLTELLNRFRKKIQ